MDDKPPFDWEYLGKCHYPVGPHIHASAFDLDCSEPAIARAWWIDYDTDFMLICPEHFELVKKEEETDGQEDHR